MFMEILDAVYISPLNSLRFVLNKLKKDKVNLNKDFYVFTGSTVGVVPILGKGLYAGKIDKLGSAKAIISLMGLHFTVEEFSKRKQDVLKSMKEQNLDALLMFRQESMYWLTGYDTFGYVFFQTLVLDQKGNVILLTRAPDLRQAQNTSNIEDIRIWVDKDGINPTDDLKIILDELDLKDKNIGIEYEAYGMTGRNALRLNKSLENYCNVEDQSELITKLRVIKSNEELVYVKKAAELGR